MLVVLRNIDYQSLINIFEESYLKSLALFFYSLKYYKILTNNNLSVIAITNFHKSKLIENGIKKK